MGSLLTAEGYETSADVQNLSISQLEKIVGSKHGEEKRECLKIDERERERKREKERERERKRE